MSATSREKRKVAAGGEGEDVFSMLHTFNMDNKKVCRSLSYFIVERQCV
jgi:hypothetical protein